MSRGINKVILIGNLGQDPETRYTQSGAAVTNFSMATSESWKDKQSGDHEERTEWHRCVAFGRVAEVCGEYLRRGSKVYVEGQLRTRKWQDQAGVDRYTTEIVVREMQMLGDRGGADNSQHASGGHSQRQGQNQSEPSYRGGPPQSDDYDDDIPF